MVRANPVACGGSVSLFVAAPRWRFTRAMVFFGFVLYRRLWNQRCVIQIKTKLLVQKYHADSTI